MVDTLLFFLQQVHGGSTKRILREQIRVEREVWTLAKTQNRKKNGGRFPLPITLPCARKRTQKQLQKERVDSVLSATPRS